MPCPHAKGDTSLIDSDNAVRRAVGVQIRVLRGFDRKGVSASASDAKLGITKWISKANGRTNSCAWTMSVSSPRMEAIISKAGENAY